MPELRWSIKGPHVVNCNCAYGCPCQFNALPTYRSCVAIAAWQIEEGHCGDTRLDGLCAVNIWAWPGAVHEGDGSMLSVIDVRADAAQRKALAAILQGEEAEPGDLAAPGSVRRHCEQGGERAENAFAGRESRRRPPESLQRGRRDELDLPNALAGGRPLFF